MATDKINKWAGDLAWRLWRLSEHLSFKLIAIQNKVMDRYGNKGRAIRSDKPR
jgi:hypothetical protein